MGGSIGKGAGIGGGLGALAGGILGTIFLPGVGGALGASLGGAILGGAGGAVGGATADGLARSDPGGVNNAASNTATANSEQAQQAADLTTTLLEQPKQISPDNFLATKTRMLANMRLGLASTITGAGGGAPAPTLSAPALTGATGKNKLGS